MADSTQDPVEHFITRWQGVTASELSTSQSFLAELCRLLDVELPHPTPEQDYLFERPITFAHGDGSTSAGRIDLYKRGCFVLESKKLRAPTHTKGFDDALLRARSQAEGYARALPASEGRPPFLVVVDVGNRIELYAEFSRSGATYTPFPDPRSHRIALADLARHDVLERLRRVWSDPLSLDPSREAARVTREIAAKLAELAKSLERAGHRAELVAQFLMRCLFTMFAEDVKLLPSESFRKLLIQHAADPDTAMRMLAILWQNMDTGGFSPAIAHDVLRFNGKLFKDPQTLPLDRDQIGLLIESARAQWNHVEPAIFGTLLERALDPTERHKLGAHYTPRAYVERLVLPTVIEPLRAEWSDAQAAALTLSAEGKEKDAVNVLRDFHHRLCTVRVLDPACGSGNFLYVTLEHLKRLEGEVLNALDEIGFRQPGLAIDGERADAQSGETVDPHQLLGIEINPRAAAIAEVVLWIGYLQWHFRTQGDVKPPQPVIRDFHNIENRDAVLAYDRMEYVTDERGVPVTRWDGVTMKKSLVTGEDVPDDSARIGLERYVNPRKAAWPQADFVVGNPPFIGNKRMRTALGDGYVEALRGVWADVPESADFVMYWWHHAAVLTQHGALERFGFITTNSIRQTFNRRVIEAAMQAPSKTAAPPPPASPTWRSAGEEASALPSPAGRRVGDEGPAKVKSSTPREPSSAASRHLLPRGEGKAQLLSLAFAIPDHPWVDTADGAAVRIAMTVGEPAGRSGYSMELVSERATPEGEAICEFTKRLGTIHPDLRAGAALTSAERLDANRGIAFTGMYPLGQGFVILPDEYQAAIGTDRSCEEVLKPFVIARDLTQKSRNARVIDFFPRSAESARRDFPSLFQRTLDRVKPERDQNSVEERRLNWWLFTRPVPPLRKAIKQLSRYLVIPRTAKWFTFQFIDSDTIPDTSVVAIASDDASLLGVLSSSLHIAWALASGGMLENRPRYQHQRTFNPFPFPTLDEDQQRISNLAEQLDAHRKRQQAAHSDLTLTGMYNVLEKLRSGEVLSAKERVIHEHGLVSVLRQLHDEIDAAVLGAYGWSDLLPLLRVAHGNDAPTDEQTCDDFKRGFDEAILERLVALNAERAAEEARGLVRWLRPEFQNPSATIAPEQAEMETDEAETISAAVIGKPLPWPKDAVQQVRAVADVLAASPLALSADDIATRFTSKGPWKKRLPQLLEMLVTLGRAQENKGRYTRMQ